MKAQEVLAQFQQEPKFGDKQVLITILVRYPEEISAEGLQYMVLEYINKQVIKTNMKMSKEVNSFYQIERRKK